MIFLIELVGRVYGYLWTLVIKSGFMCFFCLLEEHVILILIVPLTSTPLPLSLSPPSSLLCSPHVAAEARQIQAWLERTVGWNERKREAEREKGNWERGIKLQAE